MKHKGIFITGTDTDAGKTIVAAGLLDLLRSCDIDAAPMKPVQTGCTKKENSFDVPDLDFSIRYSGLECTCEEYDCMAPYRYEPACSPHLAGQLAGYYPSIKEIIVKAERLNEMREFILMEGAGGIMVPLNESEMMLDLMKKISFPVILVSRTGLGTINHTLMSLQVLKNHGINVLGVIFNNTVSTNSDNKFIIEDNIQTIGRFGKVNVLGVIDNFGEVVENNFNKMKNCFKNNINIEKIISLIS